MKLKQKVKYLYNKNYDTVMEGIRNGRKYKLMEKTI